MKRRITATFWALALCISGIAGCRAISWPQFWPFPERELTTYHTPAMRVDAIREFGTRSKGVDSPEQRQITDQLARQMQIEPDPLVRHAVVEAIAEFHTPMAQQVLEAGLSDADEAVRVACCRAIGRRAADGVSDTGGNSVAALANALRSDDDIDVRLAATEALGHFKTPDAIPALAVALEDRDPAMQYAGVQSMKSITGEDYGPDVQAWRQVAKGETPPPTKAPSVAERLRRVSPF
jgi:HEAT repeat protein